MYFLQFDVRIDWPCAYLLLSLAVVACRWLSCYALDVLVVAVGRGDTLVSLVLLFLNFDMWWTGRKSWLMAWCGGGSGRFVNMDWCPCVVYSP
jgi:hypothetical protein